MTEGARMSASKLVCLTTLVRPLAMGPIAILGSWTPEGISQKRHSAPLADQGFTRHSDECIHYAEWWWGTPDNAPTNRGQREKAFCLRWAGGGQPLVIARCGQRAALAAPADFYRNFYRISTGRVEIR